MALIDEIEARVLSRQADVARTSSRMREAGASDAQIQAQLIAQFGDPATTMTREQGIESALAAAATTGVVAPYIREAPPLPTGERVFVPADPGLKLQATSSKGVTKVTNGQQQTDLALAGVGGAGVGLVGQIGGLLTSLGLPALGGMVGTIGGLLAGGQALGLGAGGGLLGTNILGGESLAINGLVLGGPGNLEPPAGTFIKTWRANDCQFWLLRDGRRVLVHNERKGYNAGYKIFRLPRLAVIGKNMPSHRQLVRLRGNLKRHSDDAVTILQLTKPYKLASYQKRSRTRYIPRRRH